MITSLVLFNCILIISLSRLSDLRLLLRIDLRTLYYPWYIKYCHIISSTQKSIGNMVAGEYIDVNLLE